MRLLCLGFSYTAQHFIARHSGRFSTIAATFRRPETAERLRNAKIDAVPLSDEGHALRDAVSRANVLLVSAGPDEKGDPFVKSVAEALTAVKNHTDILYLSTVGVYGDHDGAWVTEATVPRPSSPRSHWRLAAEQAWLALGARGNLRVQIFRLAGIYGPGRSAVDNLRAGTAKRIIKPGQVFNRIHVDDIGETLIAALERGDNRAIWNVADDEPAPPQEVVTYAAGVIGVAPPPEIPFAEAELSPMARSFYSETKRISNRAIRERLGMRLLYPTYREGIGAIAVQRQNTPAP